MDERKLLGDAGLNKYETAVYLTLLGEGIMEASSLSRKSEVPMGKVYEILTTLNNSGFVEIQQSRPKKYHALAPGIAFEKLYRKKEEEKKNELKRFRDTISEIEKALSQRESPENAEMTFWSAKLGKEELEKAVEEMYAEIQREVCVVNSQKYKGFTSSRELDLSLPPIVSGLIPLVRRGVSIKIIDPGSQLLPLLRQMYSSIEDESLNKKIRDLLEVKILETRNEFVLIDSNLTRLNIGDPVDPEKELGVIKIYDRALAGRVKLKFEELWSKGNKVSF